MDDYYHPSSPLEFIGDILTFGLLVFIVLVIYVIGQSIHAKVDAWLWARRRAKWAKQER